MRLYALIICGLFFLVAGAAPTPANSYQSEIKQQLATLRHDEQFCPQNPLEKVFFDIFSFATKPYTQPICRLTVEACPQLHELVCKLCKSYSIEKPQLLLACDLNPNNIDIKLCTFKTASALLIHPGTVAALSTKVFERYVEQSISRIKTTVFQFKNHVKTHRAPKGQLIVTLPLITLGALLLTRYYAGKEGHEKYLVPVGCGMGYALHAVLLYRWLTKKHTGFSFQRISSFHNNEQAREDFFPEPAKGKDTHIVTGPDELFGVSAITQTQNYLKIRNDEFDAHTEEAGG